MEVHAHTHSPRKKWTHYFWEFLMLFLAVFCGFLAEYALEHKIEKDKERQYIRSFVEDLKSDSIQLKSLIQLFSTIIINEDSLKLALQQPDILNNPANAYRFIGYPLDGYAFHRSERTIQQLKNAGGLRLIHSIDVSNKINEYDETYRKSQEVNGVQIETYYRYLELLNRVADADLIAYPYKEKGQPSATITYRWLTNDPKELQMLFNITQNFQWITIGYKTFLEQLFQQAIELTDFLKKEYHLK